MGSARNEPVWWMVALADARSEFGGQWIERGVPNDQMKAGAGRDLGTAVSSSSILAVPPTPAIPAAESPLRTKSTPMPQVDAPR
jgi:hypothetical protein